MGYTDQMHRWMQMSDLFIGKPGGLTTAECLASGLPMVIVAPIPRPGGPQQRSPAGKGVAIKCNEFTTLAYKVDGLFQEPGQLEAMRRRALAYGRPQAAATIVDTLLHQPVQEAAQITPTPA
ncbi:MAG: glycosyltransferase [Verrucomicrobiota bacterium]